MTADRRLGTPRARAGAATPTRVGSGVEPAVDAVELYAPCLWLKGSPLVTAELAPAVARNLAVELLIAAERIESRRTERERNAR